MRALVTKIGPAARLAALLALQLATVAVSARAQSSDVSLPTPVVTNEVAGRVAPLDIGDARVTRHFYAFGGQPGDLELTVESNNLEGDVDVFAAATLRPLAKVTLYAGLGSAVSRTIYLRRAESIILRVQARTPNDAEGTYRVRLGGTFVAAAASSEISSPTASATPALIASRPADGKVRRVTSSGARIEEPKAEAAGETEVAKPEVTARADERAAPTPAPAPRRTARRTRPATRTGARTETPRPSDSNEPARPATRAEANRGARNSRNARTRREAARGTERATPETPPAASAPDPAASSTSAPAATSAAAGLELPGTRLVLELREGGQLVREMSAVRRVTVERGLIVILLKSGRVERQPLSNVLRMSIEP